MKLMYAGFILLMALMTSAQCQQTAEDWFNKGDLLLYSGKYNESIEFESFKRGYYDYLGIESIT